MILQEIATGVWETIYNIGLALARKMINGILVAVGVIVPNFQDGLDAIYKLFDLVTPSVVFCFDALLLSPLTIRILLSSLLFTLTARPMVFIAKILVKWWDRVFI